MRNTKAHDTKAHASWRTLGRIGRLTAIALGVGLVMAAGPVRAADDEEDDEKTFEEKVIEGIMRGIGGTNMENRGIDYRERSPLVVPGCTGSLSLRGAAAVLPTASSAGVRMRAASRGSLFSFLRAAAAALRR